MAKRIMVALSMLVSAVLVAQQPVPMGKVDNSSRNYRSADGTVLSKHSSDSDLERALNEDFGNNPEFSGVQVAVKHHSVTLRGSVLSKEAKKRAERVAQHTVGVNFVHNRIKVGENRDFQRSSAVSDAH